MKNLTLVTAVILIFFGLSSVFCQDNGEEIAAYIEYYENNSGELRMVTAEEELYADSDFFIGDPIPVGMTIVTDQDDFVEMQLFPSESIVKISQLTNFKLESLQGVDGAGENSFSVAAGKFRAVVGKISGDEKYNFKSPTAVCGIRGTDFGMNIPIGGGKEEAFVLDGAVDF